MTKTKILLHFVLISPFCFFYQSPKLSHQYSYTAADNYFWVRLPSKIPTPTLHLSLNQVRKLRSTSKILYMLFNHRNWISLPVIHNTITSFLLVLISASWVCLHISRKLLKKPFSKFKLHSCLFASFHWFPSFIARNQKRLVCILKMCMCISTLSNNSYWDDDLPMLNSF